MSVTLEEMPAERFEAWRAATVARLADLRAASGLRPPAEAAEQAEGIVARRFAEGSGSGQHVFEIRDDGRVAGSAWLEVDDAAASAMLLAFDPDDALTGSRALALVEERARALSAQRLNVDLFAQDRIGGPPCTGAGTGRRTCRWCSIRCRDHGHPGLCGSRR
ncbi:hypothetical protein [Microbacterium stercoris]|uniref:N-acetyltransferase domain-containing protein n=1 Tax=Microbacterium stercoris TaxID=2820289 RepID=A0A939TQU0_9MICO|nr:hypothetical protein [Microbacterium stercoris]MBO3663466.1 hypothetical protein [Microbacterium stercoris]